MARVISLHSFRGGTGKSNITASLAAVLTLEGRRVGVIDTDIQSPGIHVLFKVGDSPADHTLNDYLWERCRITDAAHDVTPVQAEQGKLFFVPSSIRINEISRILHEGYDARMLKDGFKMLIQDLDLDYLLIDTHPGLNEETLLSIAISHTLIIILRPDQQDYQGTSVTLEVAERLGVPNMLLVLNKGLPDVDPEAYRARLLRTYGVDVGAVIPLSTELVSLGSEDIFYLSDPGHPFSQEIKTLGQKLIAME